jgi:hypothetical protein
MSPSTFASFSAAPTTFVEKIKGAGPVTIVTDPLGGRQLAVKIPGFGGNMEDGSTSFDPASLAHVAMVIEDASDGFGPAPFDVLRQTVQGDGEGGVSFKLSHEKRARTISLDRREAAEFVAFLNMLDSMWQAANPAEPEPEEGEEVGE